MNQAENLKKLHRISSPEAASDFLIQQIKLLPKPLQILAQMVYNSADFRTWPASLKGHQAYKHGLMIHTAQVMDTALAMASTITDADPDIIRVAVMWHDYAKVLDYTKEKNQWVGTEHRYRIRHLTKSYALFFSEATNLGLSTELIDKIGHIMLAHHGRLEWESPILPQTPEAWIVHASDNLSARYVREF